MTRLRIVTALCLAVLLGLSLAFLWGGTPQVVEAAPHKKVDLSGTYKCEGWGPQSNPRKKAEYELEVVVEGKGNDTYLITWKLPDGKENKGVGLYDPKAKVFAAGYNVGKSPGVAIYQLSKRNRVLTCRGTFSTLVPRVAYERWTKR